MGESALSAGLLGRRVVASGSASPRHARDWAPAALFVALLAAAVSRSLYILFEGRFWAEEGAVYFQHAHDASALHQLLFVYERAGYYHLFANVATWFATLVPLRDAPLVTAWLSFGVLATVVWVALSWPSELLTTRAARLGAATLLVVGTLATSQVWMNSLQAQVYLGILAVLLLFVDVDALGSYAFGFGVAALVVAGFSGLYAAALAPLFVARAWIEPSRRRTVYATVACVTALVQFAALLTSRSSGAVSQEKLHLPSIGAVARSVAWQASALVFGPKTGSNTLDFAKAHGNAGVVFVTGCAIVVVGFVAFVLARAANLRVVLFVAAAFVIVEVVVAVGANGQIAAGRYAVVPIAILTLALVRAVTTAKGWFTRAAAASLCAVVLFAGAVNFWTGDPPSHLRCEGCSSWQDDVRAWQSGKTSRLHIWPYPQWTVALPR